MGSPYRCKCMQERRAAHEIWSHGLPNSTHQHMFMRCCHAGLLPTSPTPLQVRAHGASDCAYASHAAKLHTFHLLQCQQAPAHSLSTHVHACDRTGCLPTLVNTLSDPAVCCLVIVAACLRPRRCVRMAPVTLPTPPTRPNCTPSYLLQCRQAAAYSLYASFLTRCPRCPAVVLTCCDLLRPAGASAWRQ